MPKRFRNLAGCFLKALLEAVKPSKTLRNYSLLIFAFRGTCTAQLLFLHLLSFACSFANLISKSDSWRTMYSQVSNRKHAPESIMPRKGVPKLQSKWLHVLFQGLTYFSLAYWHVMKLLRLQSTAFSLDGHHFRFKYGSRDRHTFWVCTGGLFLEWIYFLVMHSRRLFLERQFNPPCWGSKDLG